MLDRSVLTTSLHSREVTLPFKLERSEFDPRGELVSVRLDAQLPQADASESRSLYVPGSPGIRVTVDMHLLAQWAATRRIHGYMGLPCALGACQKYPNA
ncbi:MAG: hypothetical protein RL653_1925 [Pseudomonadota bacterium]